MTTPRDSTIRPAEIKAFGTPLLKALKTAERPLQVIKGKSAWHDTQHTALKAKHTQLTEACGQLGAFVGKPKTDPGLPAFKKSVDDFLTSLKTAVEAKVESTYYFGDRKVANQAALVTAVKGVLPTADQNHAAQAVTDAANGNGAKDAAVAGAGVKHASSGVAARNTSCTVFYTQQELNDGLEQRMTVVAVGSHRGSSSYVIHDKLTSKLVKDKTYQL